VFKGEKDSKKFRTSIVRRNLPKSRVETSSTKFPHLNSRVGRTFPSSVSFSLAPAAATSSDGIPSSFPYGLRDWRGAVGWGFIRGPVLGARTDLVTNPTFLWCEHYNPNLARLDRYSNLGHPCDLGHWLSRYEPFPLQ
jgi:hypothetical protein